MAKKKKDFSSLSQTIINSGATTAPVEPIEPIAPSAPIATSELSAPVKPSEPTAPIEPSAKKEPVAPNKLVKHGYVVSKDRHEEIAAIAHYSRLKIQDIVEEAFADYVKKFRKKHEGKIPLYDDK